MKRKCAFYLRKLADLFDEKVKPSTECGLAVSISADTTQFMQAMASVEATIERLLPKMERLSGVAIEMEERKL